MRTRDEANSRPTAADGDLAARVKAAALAAGFDAAGICDLRPIERPALRQWLDDGYAGTMRYLHRQAPRRRAPDTIVPGARRAVVVLRNYYPDRPATFGRTSLVARYAWGEDYHRVVGDRLAALADQLITLGSTPSTTRWFVDAGPVPERELAQRAGLGWIGKNTMLIRPGTGSFTFIGAVFTDLEVPADPPFSADRCGRCRRCLDACPTAAFPTARRLDARRCIAYLTIEHREPFDAAQGPMIGAWLFGCDVCQDVCPWNRKFARPTTEPRFAPRLAIVGLDPADILEVGSDDLAARINGTALERTGAAGLKRNARQVLMNRPRSSRS